MLSSNEALKELMWIWLYRFQPLTRSLLDQLRLKHKTLGGDIDVTTRSPLSSMIKEMTAII